MPNLFHSSFKRWTFKRRSVNGRQTSEKKFPSAVKSYIKPCSLRGLWLREAAARWNSADGCRCGFLEACAGRRLFIYWFSFMYWSYFHLPEVPRSYMVIDWLETTHLSGFRGGVGFLLVYEWSLKCLIRCRGISVRVPSAGPPPHPRWVPFLSLERIWGFSGPDTPLLSFALDATLYCFLL